MLALESRLSGPTRSAGSFGGVLWAERTNWSSDCESVEIEDISEELDIGRLCDPNSCPRGDGNGDGESKKDLPKPAISVIFEGRLSTGWGVLFG